MEGYDGHSNSILQTSTGKSDMIDFEVTAPEEKEEETKETKGDVYYFPPILAAAFSAILEDLFNKLSLIVNANELPRVRKEIEKISNLENNLFPSSGEIFDSETLLPLNEALDYKKMTKFQRDVLFVRNLLVKAACNLIHKHSFDVLINKITEHKKQLQKRLDVFEENERCHQEIERISKELAAEAILHQIEIQKTREEIMKVKEEIEIKTLTKYTTMRYLGKWENSRKQLNDIVLKRAEGLYTKTIERNKREITKEVKINEQIEMFIAEQQKEYEEAIDAWIERYDTEMEQLDLDIQVVNEKIEEQEVLNAELKKKYEDRAKFIEDWLEYKEKKRLEKERIERITEASIKIQCWWRSVMIRKKLGPYGKKKKGKGKGKNKK